jgi:hypothetical protein
MILWKFILKIIGVIFLAIIIFIGGFILGFYESSIKVTMSQRAMSQYIYKEIDDNFGDITLENKEKYNIIGYIPLYKDMGFGIVLENGIKTIRVYK